MIIRIQQLSEDRAEARDPVRANPFRVKKLSAG